MQDKQENLARMLMDGCQTSFEAVQEASRNYRRIYVGTPMYQAIVNVTAELLLEVSRSKQNG